MPFTLTDIPAAMRREGWPIGALVMERWFARPARAMTMPEKLGNVPARDVEARLVTSTWCRGVERYTTAENRLIANWSAPQRLERARRTLTDKVQRWQRRTNPIGRSFRFGDLGVSTATVDRTCQVNVETIDSPLFSVDDFYAAIGRGAVKIAVAGNVVPLKGGRLRVTIDEVGTYLRDTYDFIGDQGLGSWGPRGLRRSAFLAPDIQVVRERARETRGQEYWSVSNGSFRRWRQHYGRGGDFVIFSDVRRQRLLRPVTIELAL